VSIIQVNSLNPFNPSTNINFVVEKAGPVELAVFDILGRQVADLVNSNYAAGNYSVQWNATSNMGAAFPSGSYFVQLNTPSQKVMHRIVLIR
jgi:flagellar hook assembly protein FlgD